MKRYLRDYAILLSIAGVLIGLDQWTKYLVRTQLALTEFWSPWNWLTPYARIVHWKNTGAALGMFQNWGPVFVVLAIGVSIAIIYYFPLVPRNDWTLRLAMGFQLGGALGNVVDRLTLGYVVDFISIGNFPVFNIADASISLGVAILLLGVWLQERRKKKEDAEIEARIPPQPEDPRTCGDQAIE